jgi:hypothetical protein
MEQFVNDKFGRNNVILRYCLNICLVFTDGNHENISG